MIVDNGKYFVYRHVRLDKDEPFYIGVGTKFYNSKNDSFNERYKRAFLKAYRNPIWQNIVNKTKYQVEILIESDNYKFIEEKEIEFIKLYGRKDNKTGILANLTDGGKGQRNVFQRVQSEETRKKMSEASKGIPKSKDHKDALRQSKLVKPTRFWKGKSFDENHRLKLSLAKLGKESPLKGRPNLSTVERYKRNYTIIINNEEKIYYSTKAELKKMLGISLRTFNKIMSDKDYSKRKNISIYESAEIRSIGHGNGIEQ